MEEIILTIQEILQKGKWIKTISEVRLLTGYTGHAGRQRGEIQNIVKVTSKGQVKEDKSIRWHCFDIDGVRYMYMIPAAKFEKIVIKATTPKLTLKEALEGRKQVTLDEVKKQIGNTRTRRIAITDIVKITDKGKDENGLLKWYHFDMGGVPCVYISRRTESLKNIDKLKKGEQELAENKINLVYSFLRKYGFEVEEYYDTALFAYLRAVIRYSRLQKIKEYSFSTIAYHEMKSACFQEAKKRKSVKLVSIEEAEEAGRADEIFFRYEEEFKAEREGTIEILKDIAIYLNTIQKRMLILFHRGYNFKETAGILGISVSMEERYREEIIRIAKSYYSKAI